MKVNGAYKYCSSSVIIGSLSIRIVRCSFLKNPRTSSRFSLAIREFAGFSFRLERRRFGHSDPGISANSSFFIFFKIDFVSLIYNQSDRARTYDELSHRRPSRQIRATLNNIVINSRFDFFLLLFSRPPGELISL